MSGIFILSLDTEIAWGLTHKEDLAYYQDNFSSYRQDIRRLIDLLDKYQVKASWAVVGALFLEGYQGVEDVVFPQYQQMPTPELPLDQSEYADWFFAPDIIEMIRAAKTKQELCTHTFTHIYAADPAITPEIWDAQLESSLAIFDQIGLPLRSIVYPKNMVRFTETLPKYGITSYRGREDRWYYRGESYLHKGGRLLDSFVAWPPPTYDPKTLLVGESLVNLPASQFLQHFRGVKRRLPYESRLIQARRGIQNAAKRDQIYHLWFHPINLVTSTKMFDVLEQIFIEVDRLRSSNQMKIMTMDETAAWIIEGCP